MTWASGNLPVRCTSVTTKFTKMIITAPRLLATVVTVSSQPLRSPAARPADQAWMSSNSYRRAERDIRRYLGDASATRAMIKVSTETLAALTIGQVAAACKRQGRRGQPAVLRLFAEDLSSAVQETISVTNARSCVAASTIGHRSPHAV